MNKLPLILGLSLLVCGCASASNHNEDGVYTTSNDWLLDAASDDERFQLLQRYLRGFDQPMWEIGERYKALYGSLERQNYQLSIYHWEKIRTTIMNGYLKRPARRNNAEKLFLDNVWKEVLGSLSSGDIDTAWTGFEVARDACMQCHVAESVGFMNEQPLFDLTRPMETEN